MAGHRGRTDTHVEISAVCTDPGYRRRGLGAFLVLRQVELIRAAGDVAFLHAASSNITARRLYEALGFTTRRVVQYAGVRPVD